MNIWYTKWKVARSGWPYPEGWGVYRKHKLTGIKTILDTGLSKEEAIKSCKELNHD